MLGHWRVYPLEGRLQCGEHSRRVQPKSMDVLLNLAEHAGLVVSREALLSAVWDGRAVTDEPLTRCIGELRRALGDSRATPQYIVTVPKRGYQLAQTVMPLAALESERASAAQSLEHPSHRHGRTVFIAAFGLLVAFAILAWVVLIRTPIAEFSPPDWSIVVLPFDDVSPDRSQTYLSDGVADEVMRILSGISGLRVTSRSSAFSVKREGLDVPTMAQRLDVAYVLEGSVRKSLDRVRINASLIDARTDTPIWTEDFDRQLIDIFA
ncbi:MAG: winged helix-turn-helix domain-containing protein, partial [Pseudomonadota bacterium]